MLPTIVITSIIAAVFLAIVIKGIVNKRNGKGSCSCGCGNCGMKDVCHGKKDK